MPKKRRAEVNWNAIVWGALIVNCGVGLLFSPATSLKIVRIKGLDAANRPYVESVISKHIGVPARSIPVQFIESNVLATSSIASCKVNINVFGRGTSEIAYRQPVAMIEGQSDLFIDSSGTLFRSVTRKVDSPVIRAPRSAHQAQAASLGTWPARPAADLSKMMRERGFDTRSIIDIEPSGEVSFTLEEKKVKIRLGAPYDLKKKLGKLDELLQMRPKLLDESELIVLVEPDRPTFVPKGGA